MQTFAIRNRDLVIQPGNGFATITGAQRLQQDIRLSLGEELGTDRFHPRFGSILTRFVGQPLTPALRHEVEAEVSRVLNNYLQVQQDYIKQDALNQVESRYSSEDVLAEIVRVESALNLDAIDVVITIRNLDRATIVVAQQVGF